MKRLLSYLIILLAPTHLYGQVSDSIYINGRYLYGYSFNSFLINNTSCNNCIRDINYILLHEDTLIIKSKDIRLLKNKYTLHYTSSKPLFNLFKSWIAENELFITDSSVANIMFHRNRLDTIQFIRDPLCKDTSLVIDQACFRSVGQTWSFLRIGMTKNDLIPLFIEPRPYFKYVAIILDANICWFSQRLIFLTFEDNILTKIDILYIGYEKIISDIEWI